MLSRRTALLLLLPLTTAPVSRVSGAPGFRHEIMPLLSRAGCNMGACHGSANGKGNLKLSLRGENPEADFATLTQNRESKRLRITGPEDSFLLKKPAGLTEHEGGRRFAAGSEDYHLLRAWIAAGAPADPADTPALTALKVSPAEALTGDPQQPVQLTVTAEFSNGTAWDVTRSAVYQTANLLATVNKTGLITPLRAGETTVMVRFEHLQTPVSLAFLPRRPDFRWPGPPEYNAIDTFVFAKLRSQRLLPSDLCDDTTFLRRVFFDLAGMPPSREEAEAFLASTLPDKRARLVDSLLERPEFASWWAVKWADLLRLEERVIDETGTAVMHRWICDSIAADKPVSEFARELITAEGSTYESGPPNYYRALREATVRAETTAQIFLGTRLGCAKCHNHPFERWTQDDYYRFAAIFDGIDYTILANRRTDTNDKMEFAGEQIVHRHGKRELKDPRSGREPAPGLIGDGVPPLSPGPERFAELASWITGRNHPLFAKVQANRVWAHLMGRGIVDPVDDFRLTNPPSIPALLDCLADHFIQNHFRLKPLLRFICASRTYQLSAVPNETSTDDEINFPRAIVRRLPAEPLLDAIHTALGEELGEPNFPDIRRATQIPGARFITRSRKPSTSERFLKEFGKPPRNTACECERSNASSLAQTFTLTSGPGLHQLLRKEDNRLGKLLQAGATPAAMVADLYWRTLSRPPSETEAARLVPLLDPPETRRAMLEDLAWSLINTKEFLFRR